MKKKIIILFLILLIAAGGFAAWHFRIWEGGIVTDHSEDAAFVDSVAMITGIGGNGMNSRFSGVVEAQQTVGVEVASGMKVKDTFVAVGQEVSVGTKLFSYDTDEAQNNITQLEIDIEDNNITIESTRAQVTQLEKEREKVSADERLEYTTQIMSAENSIKRAEYEQKSKQAELEALKQRIANSVVTSEIEGVVKSINKSNSGDSDSDYDAMDYGSGDSNSSAYITIMATGEYRIKGTINEQNMRDISEGMEVLVHSRVDESLTWKGVLATIDRDNPQQDQNNYYMSSDSSTSSSSYPFYVEMEDSSGLMLGQHVYVEPDIGQDEEREGMWLDEYYLIADENGEVTPYVWAASGKDRLEKREVSLGEYDADMMQYQILSGLEAGDYIALPDEEYYEGMPVTRNVDEAGNIGSDDDGEYYDDGEEVYDDGEYYDGGGEFYGDSAEFYDDGGEYYDDSAEFYDDSIDPDMMELLDIGGEEDM